MARFSKREWILTIFIIVILQFILHWLAFQYRGSSNALGYISFAGTVVSIVLGVVAIIYSFVQSISHNTSVEEMRAQVEDLITATKDINKSKDSLHESTIKIISAVESLNTNLVENNINVNKLYSRFTEGSSDSDAQNSNQSRIKISNHRDEAPPFLLTSNFLLNSMTAIIGEAVAEGWTSDKINRFILPAFNKWHTIDTVYFYGAYTSLLIILKAEGLVKGGNSAYEPLKESGSFLEKIKTIREMFATSQDENIAEIRLAIDMLKAQDAEKNSKA
ncbi:hypothetical protein ACT51S_19940 [Pseudomonas aeruginosa]|uniref:hypothetical protein n=1 Tax=Pseudomonas aeruginosa TaxID=287 RepID=UPI000A898CCE|nr:hypothetical protein [Pseudomonas aeruginosa]ELK4797424.1 hypothetical protein [Pseudomonas aeruginosa]ELK4819231.1 hypothetical protein [Pseudomonas aeruginosa]ELK4827896.1 hypothetical protein [Pseudomonas aeruginosa]ELK4890508.1 hypothetical protein [Pseudomonas aeruginosa]MBG7404497.1 hypothetical protein [Pseudomonas aeruginosa]